MVRINIQITSMYQPKVVQKNHKNDQTMRPDDDFSTDEVAAALKTLTTSRYDHNAELGSTAEK